MHMTVLVVSAVPEHTHGVVSRWLQQISPTTYIGTLNRRVRELLWTELKEIVHEGNILLAWASNTEQGFEILSFGPRRYIPHDRDGPTLIASLYIDNKTVTPF